MPTPVAYLARGQFQFMLHALARQFPKTAHVSPFQVAIWSLVSPLTLAICSRIPNSPLVLAVWVLHTCFSRKKTTPLENNLKTTPSGEIVSKTTPDEKICHDLLLFPLGFELLNFCLRSRNANYVFLARYGKLIIFANRVKRTRSTIQLFIGNGLLTTFLNDILINEPKNRSGD